MLNILLFCVSLIKYLCGKEFRKHNQVKGRNGLYLCETRIQTQTAKRTLLLPKCTNCLSKVLKK